MHRRTNRDTADDALVVFLKTGRLPWSFPLAPGRHLEDALVEIGDGAAEAEIDLRRRPTDPKARARLEVIYMIARDWFSGVNPQYWYFPIGLLLILVVLFLPNGILGGVLQLAASWRGRRS